MFHLCTGTDKGIWVVNWGYIHHSKIWCMCMLRADRYVGCSPLRVLCKSDNFCSLYCSYILNVVVMRNCIVMSIGMLGVNSHQISGHAGGRLKCNPTSETLDCRESCNIRQSTPPTLFWKILMWNVSKIDKTWNNDFTHANCFRYLNIKTRKYQYLTVGQTQQDLSLQQQVSCLCCVSG